MGLAAVLACAVPMQAQASSGKVSGKSVVVYFSRAGYNYGVGKVKTGNTAIVAKIIAKKTGSDIFRIKPKKAYPTSYSKCLKRAEKEQDSDARPKMKKKFKKLSKYKTIYIGYPIWHGDMPMIMYTFLESQKKGAWKGKKVVPFCTNEGSGLSDTRSTLKKKCKGAKVLKGLSIQGSVAQKNKAKATKKVNSWLKKIGAR